MILRHCSHASIRVLMLAALSFFIGVVVFFDSHKPADVSADPAFGEVRPFPTSGVIIENHIFPLNVRMTTCADNAVVPGGDTTSSTSTTVSDSTKSWTTNQWAGYDIQLTSGAQSPQWRTVVSNTNNTITVNAAWGGVADSGTATNATTTTLVDTGSNWLTNQFAGMTLEMPSLGTGPNRTIVSNTTDTLTVAAWPALVTETATASDGDSSAASELKDTSVSWTTNQWAGKAVQINSGTNAGQTRRIVSNTSNTLTLESTWATSAGGSATAGSTSTTFVDATASWTANAFVGMRIDILSGAASGDSRVISANTATTLTVPAWDGGQIPAFGDFYRIVRVPDATSQYIIRDGAATGTPYEIKLNANPSAGTDFQIFKSHCRPGGANVTVTYNEPKFDVILDGGISTGGNTSTTINDSTANWKINSFAGSRVVITVGTGTGQSRTVVSNTKTQIVVTPAWSVPIPTNGSFFQVGGGADGGFITSTGRTLNCPGGTIYGSNTVSVDCVTLGSGGANLPQGPTGIGNLTNVIFKAIGRGVSTFTVTAQVLEVDGTIIPADVFSTNRRVTLCPDSAPPAGPDGLINVADLGNTAAAFGQGPGGPNYTPQKNPDENSIINVADLGIIASVFGKRCIQP